MRKVSSGVMREVGVNFVFLKKSKKDSVVGLGKLSKERQEMRLERYNRVFKSRLCIFQNSCFGLDFVKIIFYGFMLY